MFQSKAIGIRALVAIFGIAFGILITAQMRSLPGRVVNPIAPYSSLKETKEELYLEQTDLMKNIADLQKSLETAQNETVNAKLTKVELADLQTKKALVGLTKLNGMGVIVTLDDSKGKINEDSIVHAADLRDIINVLWGAGAEAITINDQRVVINTAIDCIVNTILVNNTRLSTPFRIEAIGDQQTMYQKISDQNLLSGLHKRKNEQGLIFEISKNKDITVPVYNGSFEAKSGAI